MGIGKSGEIVDTKKLKIKIGDIVVAENGKISENALKLIVKISEGSVRDGLSLLDRALISKNIDEGDIDEKFNTNIKERNIAFIFIILTFCVINNYKSY